MEYLSGGLHVNQAMQGLSNEIELIVEMNRGEAVVLKHPINLKYYKFDGTIIGTDGIFYVFYYRHVDRGFQAFAGRKFNLIMHDGEVVECNGQWWDGKTSTAKMLVDQPLIPVPAISVKGALDCYVYCGYEADAAKFKKLREAYKGDVYKYHDGQTVLKSRYQKRGKLKAMITCYDKKRAVVDEHNSIFYIKIVNGKVHLVSYYPVDPKGLFKEYLTEGKKDFSIKQPRVINDFGKCADCGSVARTKDYETPVCHKCLKEREEEYNQEDYSSYRDY